ncbi:MAG TPA: tryptophan--tRNA ligase [Candidatus Paceibacterota bacterium]
MTKKILLSGVKPTGRPHIGNYFGAMKQFVDMLNTGEYQCYFMIADYHSLNFIQNAEQMRQNIIDLALDYVAIGLDPKKCVLFKSSDVTAHTELAWIFDTITTMPYLMRAHAFKDAEAKDKEITVGTFNYPMLMAADILLYGTEIVPVGQDQKQHVEYARDTAQKFNNTFGETFILPKEMIVESVKIVPGTDGRKMSKSYGNTIPLFATDDEIKKAVMSIVTDSSGGVPVNVRAIHELFRDKAYLDTLYAEKAGKYKDLKEALVADVQNFIRPMRERREKLAKNRNKIIKILAKGGKKANKKANETMERVKKAVGVTL